MRRWLPLAVLVILVLTLLVVPLAVSAQPVGAPGADGTPTVKVSDAKTLMEMNAWELFLKNITRDYVLAYFMVTLLAIIGLFTRSRRLRYISLAGSVLFLGFMVGLRLSGLGGPTTIVFILMNHTVKVNTPYFMTLGFVVLGGLTVGRAFCGWGCPMGALQQLFFRDTAIKVSDRWHKYLRYLPYGVLAAAVVSVAIVGADFWGPNDPFRTLFRGFGAWPRAFSIEVIPAILLSIVVLLSLVLFTPWCKYVCPLGALLSLFSKISLFRVRIDEIKCTDCKRCTKIDCNYQAITVGDKGAKPVVQDLQCTACGECIHKCPDAAISMSLPKRLTGGRDLKWLRYASISVWVGLTVFVIVAATALQPTDAAPTTTPPEATAPAATTPAATTPAATTPTATTPAPTTPGATTPAPTTPGATTPAPTTPAPTTPAATTPAVTTPPAPPAPPPVMTELGVVMDYITPNIATDELVEIRVRTVPGATVYLQVVNPNTGTWSAWPKPADGGKIKVADADGICSWSWVLFNSVAKGEGDLHFLVTSNTDPAYAAKQWKSNMTDRQMNNFAKNDDTIKVSLTWQVAKSDY